MDKHRFLAVVEFRHGRDCTTGQPYGSCSSECSYKVVKKVSEDPLTRWELHHYGVEPVEERH